MKKALFNVLMALVIITGIIVIAAMVRADYLIYLRGMDKHAVLDPMKPYVKSFMIFCWTPFYCIYMHKVIKNRKEVNK